MLKNKYCFTPDKDLIDPPPPPKTMAKKSKKLAEIVARFDEVKLRLADMKIDLAGFVCENRDDKAAALILRAIDRTSRRLANEFELLENVADGQEVAK